MFELGLEVDMLAKSRPRARDMRAASERLLSSDARSVTTGACERHMGVSENRGP